MNKWKDITVTVESGMVHWPGDAEVEVYKSVSMDNGADANVTNIRMSAHTGTHVDAPLHFMKEGNDVSVLSLDRMIGQARVIRIHNKKVITLDDILPHTISEGERILFRTVNSDTEWSKRPFMQDYVYLSTDVANFLVEQKVKTIGVDYLSVAAEENGAEVHRILLKNEVLIIEGLLLNDVDEGFYEMICLPMKLGGADGAPARVVVRKLD
jgi:arylformamidase